ncbi:Flagellum-specific ATP synthase FliI [Olavius algarvensis spirochete endosymbiont]|uniref:FliI/YscN family ATPase n=1 Tax=Olavius algarvensis spirochete endosymbiont TaxID=260710 RepID=UPI000F0FD7AB|nr:FliI/YscN family ATPase [Olavius algarvensis spirochete endosymbiont]CAD7843589.1 MAG: Flagellum-specific ATP synthase FliI [Olavius algarvensis spirochete endosymbiont]VDA99340.1 Flagellum-specific ATP synthase FliI [Olavius algarvensis spirochete endosymbiont]
MLLKKYMDAVGQTDPIKYSGRLKRVQGILLESIGPKAAVGEICHIMPREGKSLLAEVVSVRDEMVQLMSYEPLHGLETGDLVIASGSPPDVSVGIGMLGRVLNALGMPIDGKGPISLQTRYPMFASPPPPMDRAPISKSIDTGIRAIDAITPIGRGQRMGIFAGSGIGKSTLLGMVARNTSADVNVIALIGERGREVREFIESELGEEGLKHSVLVVSTSDTPALARVRGAFTATTIAEFFRDQGNDVMLLFDSVTRFAMSQREIGLAIGEPPTTRSYTPSVFSLLPRLLERAGIASKGTITGLYTVLVEGDDLDEPVSDAVRGYLDGHIVLDRRLAEQNHYPAIDILASVSRVAPRIMGIEAAKTAAKIRKLVAAYRDKEDLIDVGAYAKGTNPDVDEAIDKREELDNFLIQGITEHEEAQSILSRGTKIAGAVSDVQDGRQ